MRRVHIGRQSAGFVERGHPWIRVDRFTKGLEHCHTGEAVTLVDERGRSLASALIDREHPSLVARVFDARPERPFDPALAIRRAWERRAALHRDAHTTAYRVVHGEADFLPGLRVERYGNCLALTLEAACLQPHAQALAAACADCLPGCSVVLREHLDDLRRAPVAARVMHGPDVAEVACQELGVPWLAQPSNGLATGIYVDQRATRSWLRKNAADKRVLNLFAYTGLFSASLVHAGAAQATCVDLSAPALAYGRACIASAGLSQRHRSVQADCRVFLQDTSERWDIILCDPPTAAQGGQGKGWLAARDYPALLRAALTRLAPGGLLVAINNTRGKPFDLAAALQQAVQQAQLSGNAESVPEPGEDIPQRRGFPEGRPWRAVAWRASDHA